MVFQVLPDPRATGSFAQASSPAHVVIAVEENRDFSRIIGSGAAPFINSLAADTRAALFTQSYALTHPSQPNYLMLFSGSDQSVKNDRLPAGLPFSTMNLGASLIESGRSFTGYSEDLPHAGFNGPVFGAYARKHNPWANWQDSPIRGIPAGANLPLADFPAEYDSLPTVSFVIPNQDNDMHNGSDPEAIRRADKWLEEHLSAYIRWAKTHNSLFILTFDEGSDEGSNRIPTLFVGQMIRGGMYDARINHYSVLRTIEDMFGLPHAGGSAEVRPVDGCWIGTPAAPIASLPGPESLCTILTVEFLPGDRHGN
jgi:phosphatidylinositol-3-phosphatase